MKRKLAALVYGNDAHYLDHLAAICDLMEMPLIVTENEDLVRKYYPFLEVISYSYPEIGSALVQNYDIVFYCMTRLLFDEVFFFSQKLLQKKVHTIWVPHGNSDKGHASPFMEGLVLEEVALVYGKKMIDFLNEKNVLKKIKVVIEMNNVRLQVYKKHKAFYTTIVQREIAKRVSPGKKTILYAPTWADAEKSSSFFSACPILLENLPEEYNLIVKLHPNILLKMDFQTEELINKYENHPKILFLKEFPPIYPLLDFIDIYIGDMSSIGYDCLAFDKPMFFLNQNRRDVKKDKGLFLYRCGVEIKPEEYKNIYQIIKKNLETDADFFKTRKDTYLYTFGEEKPWEKLRQEITDSIKIFPEKDLSFF